MSPEDDAQTDPTPREIFPCAIVEAYRYRNAAPTPRGRHFCAHCGAGTFYLTYHEGEDEPPAYVISCTGCSKRLSPIPGCDLERYLRYHSDDPLYEEQSAREGYLPPGYVAGCGVNSLALWRARRGATLVVTVRDAS